MSISPFPLLSLGILIPSAVLLAEEAPLPAKIEFNRDVRPILSENCFHCHGFDQKTREANRRLDTREGALAENDGIRAIVPGKLRESDTHVRIHSSDKDEKMPPADSGKKLTARQIAILDKWVEQGADYQEHWAYIAPSKPAPPSGQHPIDALVRARLTEQGLKPSHEADKTTLMRRLSLDLTGLPPRPEDHAAFITDAAPGAYERLVEKLLASPHYGERMAIPWLDVVRFADTIGYHSDNPRNVWPYRDYVINAFNSNKRFDQFTLEQIAGDLLPESGQEQKIGSAFNRLLLSTEEGGAQAKDYESRMLTDRVRAVGTAWLGQTIGCAQCHDHKFDPISTRDFYTLGAFFADIKEGIIGAREAGMLVFTPEQKKQHDSLTAQLAGLTSEFGKNRPELAPGQQAWETDFSAAVSAETGTWRSLTPVRVSTEKNNISLRIEKDALVSAQIDTRRKVRGQSDGTDTYRVTVKLPLKGVTGFRIEALRKNAPTVGLASNGNFVLSEVSIEGPGKKPIALSETASSFEQSGFSSKSAIDGISTEKANGWAVLGGTGAAQALVVKTSAPLEGEGETELTFHLKFAWGDYHGIRQLRLSATSIAQPTQAKVFAAPEKDIEDVLKTDPSKRTPPQKTKLVTLYREFAPELLDLRTRLQSATMAKNDFEANLPNCLVSSQGKPRTVRILPRGDWMNESGEVVSPALPHFLPQPKREGNEPLTRLDLARWLVSRENPLTARVFVNRLWKQFFGTGLSKVLDDLGAQGEPPVNPALLDWLASEFMDSGWDVKHVVRLIVTSQTYRQTSTASKELQARDPYNRELARQSRWRLDAELVRDQALQVAGLLQLKVGGPSVKPYQPENYWENLNFPTRVYENERETNQYRRGLYTWWQRSYLHPSMLAFDAPSREECTAERIRSNIPQQALVLLNDPSYVEAARVFAARILSESRGANRQRLAWAFEQALSRPAREEELKALTALLDANLPLYQQNPAAAAALLGVGLAPQPQNIDPAQLAAWTQVARALLNLHETITRS
jgi:hypothetical protein